MDTVKLLDWITKNYTPDNGIGYWIANDPQVEDDVITSEQLLSVYRDENNTTIHNAGDTVFVELNKTLNKNRYKNEIVDKVISENLYLSKTKRVFTHDHEKNKLIYVEPISIDDLIENEPKEDTTFIGTDGKMYLFSIGHMEDIASKYGKEDAVYIMKYSNKGNDPMKDMIVNGIYILIY